jgi:NADH:ubiquinone oxidoreductase subunit 4 (subunit M)
MFLYVLIDVSYRAEVALPLKRMFVGEFIIIQFVYGSTFHFHMQDED